MRYIYNLVFYIALPFILLRLLWKARKSPAYYKRWQERLALMKTAPLSNSIWIHAVSLGESIAATPLIKNLIVRYPNSNIVVTTMTPSGSEYIRKSFADTVLHTYVPYDYSGAVKRFLNYVNPQLLVIMETELWPNILHYCAVRHTPVLLANARLSKHSMRGYMRLPRLTQKMLNNISMIAAQSQLDAQRFINLGADSKRVTVVGNIKFDITIAQDLPYRAQQLRQRWGQNRPVWIAASTHAGEETKILQANTVIKRVFPNSLLVLVPRHTERCAHITELCEQQGFNVISHKQSQPCLENTDIVIGDTMGELLLLYAASDVAFVGGSLEPSLGGHNLLEPAALNIPVITGLYISNFIEINSLLINAGALIKINDVTELANNVIRLFQSSSLRKKLSTAGLRVVQQNKGALQKLLSWIEDNLSYSSTGLSPWFSAKADKILIVGPAWIGDMVMAQTLFKLLKQCQPNAIIHVLSPKWTSPLLERMPEVDHILISPFMHKELNLYKRYIFAKKLRNEGYHRAVVLPNSFKSALIPFWARIPRRTGWRGEMRYWLINDMRILDKSELPLMIQRFAALGLNQNEFLPEQLPWPALRAQPSSKKVKQSVLALCPGAEYGPTKQWPANYFAEVAKNKLASGWQVWIFGSKKDQLIANKIQQLTDNACIDFTGKTSLQEVIDLMPLANAIVSNDTGLMHIAASLHRPLVVIYGSSSPQFTPPLTKNAQIFSLNLSCSPCFKKLCPLKHVNCLINLTPEIVLAALNKI